MILLTALAIAFPIEVPSLQRASNAIPPAYLIAALPLAILCAQFYRTLPRLLGPAAAVGFAVIVIAAAYQYNRELYFGDFMENYHRSAQNHAEAGQVLRGFAESDGAYGNAFIIASPHWWDHRAVGVEAGAIRWDNSIVEISRMAQYIRKGLRRTDEYQLQPERDLLFFYAPRNEAAAPLLRQWFPAGRQMEIRQEPADKTFFIYRVPGNGRRRPAKFPCRQWLGRPNESYSNDERNEQHRSEKTVRAPDPSHLGLAGHIALRRRFAIGRAQLGRLRSHSSR